MIELCSAHVGYAHGYEFGSKGTEHTRMRKHKLKKRAATMSNICCYLFYYSILLN